MSTINITEILKIIFQFTIQPSIAVLCNCLPFSLTVVNVADVKKYFLKLEVEITTLINTGFLEDSLCIIVSSVFA
jgi:hypothetical protein